tara:strand:- start:356 stop:1432 length:1077 start_codon:yes stop_codon:yes gene_type:complete
MSLIQHEKDLITIEVARKVARSSQNKVARNAKVSGATINKIVNRKWHNISEEMWRRVRVNLRINTKWKTAETVNFKLVNNACRIAKSEGITLMIADNAGKGKSESYKYFERNHDEVIYIECMNVWTRKEYIKNLCQAAGVDRHGTLHQIVDRFIKHIKGLRKPLLIIDQFDKLKDSQLDLFMDFYNEMDGNCGFILSGVLALEKRILRGVNRAKIGYEELYSRGGRKFIRLDPISENDVKLVCNTNGLHDEQRINTIYHTCEQDYRRVKREVERYHLRTLQQKEVIFEEVKAEMPKGVRAEMHYMHDDEISKALTASNNDVPSAISKLKEVYRYTALKDSEIKHLINVFQKKQEPVTA